MFGAKKWTHSVSHIMDCLREIIEEHQKNFEVNNIKDFIDAYIAEQRRQEHDVNSTFSGMFVYYNPSEKGAYDNFRNLCVEYSSIWLLLNKKKTKINISFFYRI